MFAQRLDELNQVVLNCEHTTAKGKIHSPEALKISHFLLQQIQQVQGIVYVIGNGGSAGIASHFCTDLLRTLDIAAATLTDSNVVTCFANDFGYENVFSMPLERTLKAKDLLVAISSSGKSSNILKGVAMAKEKKAAIITLSGFSMDNPLRKMGDLNFWLASNDYGLVETGHFFLLHTIIDSFKMSISEKHAHRLKPMQTSAG